MWLPPAGCCADHIIRHPHMWGGLWVWVWARPNPLPVLCVSFNSLLDTERQISLALSVFYPLPHGAYNPFRLFLDSVGGSSLQLRCYFPLFPQTGFFFGDLNCATFIVSGSPSAHCCCFFLCQALYSVFKASFSARYVLGDLLFFLPNCHPFL